MIALLLVSLFVAVLGPAVALALFLCKRKGAARRFAVESVVVACIVAAILFLGPRSAYDVGRDTVHAFGEGRFQIWAEDDVAYVFFDVASVSLENKDLFGVVKWAEAKDGYCLITKDGLYHFVDARSGKRDTYREFNDIPPTCRETFRKMCYWGPYGQLWEDVSHVGWRVVAIVVVLFAYFIRVLMFVILPERRGMNGKETVK